MARKPSQKQKQINKEYAKARDNLLRQYREMKRKGYQFDENPIPEIPKNKTAASIRKIKGIQEKLYDISYHITEDGERLTGRQYKNVRRWEGAEKAKETREKKKNPPPPPEEPEEPGGGKPPEEPAPPSFADAVIAGFYDDLESTYNNDGKLIKGYEDIKDWMDQLVASEDKEEIALMIEKGTEEGYIINWDLLYNPNQGYRDQYKNAMIRYLGGKTAEEKDEIIDKIAAEDDTQYMDIPGEDEEFLYD